MTKQPGPEADGQATRIEREFLEALSRIVSGHPSNPRLAAQAARGALRPSQSNVALEAGHSRTHISGAACALPRVRLAIKKAQARHSAAKRPESVLSALDRLADDASLLRACEQAKRERDEMRRKLDAAHTSAAASTMLAVALRRAGRVGSEEVSRLRRLAEQSVLEGQSIAAS